MRRTYTRAVRSREDRNIEATNISDPLDLAVVGAGRVGTALAVLLRRAGHRVTAASGRRETRDRVDRYLPGVPFVPQADAVAAAPLVILATPDDAIQPTCETIRPLLGPSHSVVHLSGSVSLEALDAARAAGSLTLAIHPLQTFPDVDTAVARIPGSPVAVTAADQPAAELGERLARDAGGEPFRLDDERKPLYHAAAVFASNYLATVEGVAERLFRAAGIEDPLATVAPLVRSTLANVLVSGPAQALTGPASRGDAGTVERNLEALRATAPETVPAYVALARLAADLAEGAGRLDARGRARLEEVLAAWT